jgi:Zn-dependent protease with chaperone function
VTSTTNEPTLDEAGRTLFPGISSRAFEHPADRAALVAMRAVPGFDQLIKFASGFLRERQYRLAFLASSVRVDERQFADLNQLLGEAVTVLDAPARPELYVANDPFPNAATLGVDKPFIVMSSGLYELLTDDERRFVVAHELGHAMSGHALYKSLLLHLLNLAGVFGWAPGGLALRPLIAALREWDRKSELSGDRAGLLATQDLDVALRVHMKLAGGAHLDLIDPDAFLAQAADYDKSGDLRDGVLKLLNTERSSHPFAVVRAAELRRWAASDEYRHLLDGSYPRREDDRAASFTESAREAVGAYRKRIEESSDPLVSAVRGVGLTLGDAADSLFDWVARRARGGEARNDAPSPGAPSAANSDQPDGSDKPAAADEAGAAAESGTSPDPDQL